MKGWQIIKSILDVKYGNEGLQMLDIHIPEGDKFPVFIYLHGGGLECGDLFPSW